MSHLLYLIFRCDGKFVGSEQPELLFHAMVRCEQQHDVDGAAVGTELGINWGAQN